MARNAARAVGKPAVRTSGARLLGSLGASLDLRGADARYAAVHYFGSGCAGAYGPVVLVVRGNPNQSGQVAVGSGNHAAGALGAMLIGCCKDSCLNKHLPLSLDPPARGLRAGARLDVVEQRRHPAVRVLAAQRSGSRLPGRGVAQRTRDPIRAYGRRGKDRALAPGKGLRAAVSLPAVE
jgi:hypothetical protein